MKTIELSTGTLLVVDATRANVLDCMWQYHPCTILGHPSEITGEVWGRVCEKAVEKPAFVGDKSTTRYFDYSHRFYIFKFPSQSGLSLCAAHNIQESDVLLFKSKNN